MMKFQTTSKLELNIIKTNTNPNVVADFAIKNRIPVIVTPPEYVGAFVMHRGMRGGQYRIICSVDFPKGRKFALDKLKGVHEDFSMADGYEILLSENRTEIELRNEMKALREFLKQINPMMEIRWCLGAHSRDETNTDAILKGMGKFAASYVRVEHHLKMPNVGIDEHKKVCQKVSENVPFPIKISGNVDLEMIRGLADQKNIKRFDVDFDMATAIVKALENEEREQLEKLQSAKS